MNKFNSFGELSRFMHDRGFSSRGIPVQELPLSVRPTKIPLESTAGRRIVRAISVRSSVKGQQLIVGLLWHACFGKKFKVIHWQFLFELVDRTKKWSILSQVVFDVLMILNDTAKADRLNQYMSNLRPVKSLLADQRQLDKLLMKLELTGMKLPRKAAPIEELLEINFNDSIKLRKPNEPARIGVGYKDKGSLGLPGTEYDPDQISPFNEEFPDNLFIELLNNYRKENYSFKF